MRTEEKQKRKDERDERIRKRIATLSVKAITTQVTPETVNQRYTGQA